MALAKVWENLKPYASTEIWLAGLVKESDLIWILSGPVRVCHFDGSLNSRQREVEAKLLNKTALPVAMQLLLAKLFFYAGTIS